MVRGGFARAVRRHREVLPAGRSNETLFLVMDNASVHNGGTPWNAHWRGAHLPSPVLPRVQPVRTRVCAGQGCDTPREMGGRRGSTGCPFRGGVPRRAQIGSQGEVRVAACEGAPSPRGCHPRSRSLLLRSLRLEATTVAARKNHVPCVGTAGNKIGDQPAELYHSTLSLSLSLSRGCACAFPIALQCQTGWHQHLISTYLRKRTRGVSGVHRGHRAASARGPALLGPF